MNKYLLRFVSLLLVPCLIADPAAMAAASPASWRATTPASHPPLNLFAQQALAGQVIDVINTLLGPGPKIQVIEDGADRLALAGRHNLPNRIKVTLPDAPLLSEDSNRSSGDSSPAAPGETRAAPTLPMREGIGVLRDLVSRKLAEHPDRPLLLLIDGSAGSGKSSFATELQLSDDRVATIHFDEEFQGSLPWEPIEEALRDAQLNTNIRLIVVEGYIAARLVANGTKPDVKVQIVADDDTRRRNLAEREGKRFSWRVESEVQAEIERLMRFRGVFTYRYFLDLILDNSAAHRLSPGTPIHLLPQHPGPDSTIKIQTPAATEPAPWQLKRSLLIDEAAEVLGVSRRTVYYWIKSGRLKTIRTLGGSQRVLIESLQDPSRSTEQKSSAGRVLPTTSQSSPERRKRWAQDLSSPLFGQQRVRRTHGFGTDSDDPAPFSFADHVAVLGQFIHRRQDIVAEIANLLDLKEEGHKLSEEMVQSRLDASFWSLPGLPHTLSALKGQLETRRVADGFLPYRRDDGAAYVRINEPALIEAAYRYWSGSHWPDREALQAYAQTMYASYMVHQLELLCLRLWDEGPDLAQSRLQDIQRLLDQLNTPDIPGVPIFIRDARWLIPIAQSLPTSEVTPYFKIAEHISQSFTAHDRLEIHKANAKMIGAHLRIQRRSHALALHLPESDSSVLATNRRFNAADLPLLLTDLIPLLEAYQNVRSTPDQEERLELADSILQGMSGDPELFLTRLDLLRSYTLHEESSVETDAEGKARYSAQGEAQLKRLDRYTELVSLLAPALEEDAALMEPVAERYSPYGLSFSFTFDFLGTTAMLALLPGTFFNFNFKDAYTSLRHSASQLAWASTWGMEDAVTGVQNRSVYSLTLAKESFGRLKEALRARVQQGTRLNASDRASGKLVVIPESVQPSAVPDPLLAIIEGLSSIFVYSTDRARAFAGLSIPKSKLLQGKAQGEYLVSYPSGEEWVAISKELLTAVLAEGEEGRISGIPAAAIDVLRLIFPEVVVFEPASPAPAPEQDGKAPAPWQLGRSISLLHAAELLGVCIRTIYNYIKSGRLRTIRTLGGSQRVLVESMAEPTESARPTASREGVRVPWEQVEASLRAIGNPEGAIQQLREEYSLLDWYLQSIPVQKLKEDMNSDHKFSLGLSDDDMVLDYANRPTKFPPILALIGDGVYQILDGKHRLRAAYFRKDVFIDAFVAAMPTPPGPGVVRTTNQASPERRKRWAGDLDSAIFNERVRRTHGFGKDGGIPDAATPKIKRGWEESLYRKIKIPQLKQKLLKSGYMSPYLINEKLVGGNAGSVLWEIKSAAWRRIWFAMPSAVSCFVMSVAAVFKISQDPLGVGLILVVASALWAYVMAYIFIQRYNIQRARRLLASKWKLDPAAAPGSHDITELTGRDYARIALRKMMNTKGLLLLSALYLSANAILLRVFFSKLDQMQLSISCVEVVLSLAFLGVALMSVLWLIVFLIRIEVLTRHSRKHLPETNLESAQSMLADLRDEAARPDPLLCVALSYVEGMKPVWDLDQVTYGGKDVEDRMLLYIPWMVHFKHYMRAHMARRAIGFYFIDKFRDIENQPSIRRLNHTHRDIVRHGFWGLYGAYQSLKRWRLYPRMLPLILDHTLLFTLVYGGPLLLAIFWSPRGTFIMLKELFRVFIWSAPSLPKDEDRTGGAGHLHSTSDTPPDSKADPNGPALRRAA